MKVLEDDCWHTVRPVSALLLSNLNAKEACTAVACRSEVGDIGSGDWSASHSGMGASDRARRSGQ